MNTMFATPTHTIPTGGYTPWNTFPTNWIGSPTQLNPGFGHPTFGYGYGPNGWWFGNQQLVNAGATNTLQAFGNPSLGFGWNTPGIWNSGIGTTPWNPGHLNTLPLNAAPSYGASSWNGYPSFGNQNSFGWANQPFLFNNTIPSWINPGINPSFIGNQFGTTYPTSYPTFNSFPYSFPVSPYQLPTNTGFNPGFTGFNPGFTGFNPGFTGFNPGFTGFNSLPAAIGGYPTFNTGWGATPAWNTNTGWTATPGFTSPSTTPIVNTNSPFGYVPGFPSPFSNGVPAQAGCTGREAA